MIATVALLRLFHPKVVARIKALMVLDDGENENSF
jgi:hypothetical protein